MIPDNERKPMEKISLYEEIAQEVIRLMEEYEKNRITRNVDGDSFDWPSAEKQFLLKSEAAMELGGGNRPALSGILYIRKRNPDAGGKYFQPSKNQTVTLYGPDLPEIRGDASYARITLVSVREEFMTEEHKLYNLFRSIEYIRYHVNPEGYMPRISTVKNREQVRVSKDAVKRGLDFYKVGRIYEEAYLKHPAVEAADTTFVTLEQFDYKELQTLFNRAEDITMSLDHPLKQLSMDCTTCNLRAVCDEVQL